MSASDKKKLRKEQEAASLTEKQLAQKKEDKKLKTYTMTFIVVMILVVAIAIVSLGTTWYSNSGLPARSTVALTIGETELSNTDLNYYYMDTVNNFYSEMYNTYSNYTTLYAQMMYGLDMTQPLNTQYYDEATGTTWADYFLTSAIESAEATYALVNQANAEGFEMGEDYETTLNASLASSIEMAGYYGFDSFEDYLVALYGAGANEESFVKYYTDNALADAYYSAHSDSLTYDAQTIADYNTEHYDEFSTFDYSYYYLNINTYETILEENAAEDSSEESTEPTEEATKPAEDATEPTGETEEISALRQAAQDAAKADAEWIAQAPTLLVMNKTIAQLQSNLDGDDTATEITGTTIGSVATLYADWVKDPARQAGDTTVVEYESESDDDEIVDGYYVVLFQGREDYEEHMINVRHILIEFEGGTEVTNADGTTSTVYSDEEKAAAYEKAETLYNEWLAGDATEDSFAALVAENSADTGSSSNGGLYENVYNGYMVEAFNDWCFDPARQSGDHGIVETEFGYHLMYFVSTSEQTYREFVIEYTLRSDDMNTWYQEILENLTSVEGDTSYISKNLIIAPSSSATIS